MDSTEMKIRKGQAMNLAVSAAIADHKHRDTRFIYETALYYIDLIDSFQEADLEQLKELLNDS